MEFRDLHNHPLFEVKPAMLNTFQEAPDTIRQDPLFHLLISDGSLEAVVPEERRKELEKDPLKDIAPDGKKAKTPAPKDAPAK